MNVGVQGLVCGCPSSCVQDFVIELRMNWRVIGGDTHRSDTSKQSPALNHELSMSCIEAFPAIYAGYLAVVAHAERENFSQCRTGSALSSYAYRF